MRLPWCPAVLLAAVGAAGCASAAPAPPPVTHPYRVVLLPVEGATAALAEVPGDDGIPVAATPESLESRLRENLLAARVFSDVVALDAKELGSGGDTIAAGAAAAKRLDADLILRVHVQSARFTDLGNNSSTFWSSFTWFMIPAPTWFVDDRTYQTDLAVRAELFTPDDLRKPAASLVASSGQQSLDLWDRGLSPWVPVVPPPFLEGSRETVSEELTERAIAEVTAALVEEFRRREIPSRFELRVTLEGGEVRVAAVSRRKLRALEVRSGSRVLASWAESELVPDGAPEPDRFEYRRQVAWTSGGPRPGAARPAASAGTNGTSAPAAPAADPAADVIRVVADDEVGGREVRTLRVGGTR